MNGGEKGIRLRWMPFPAIPICLLSAVGYPGYFIILDQEFIAMPISPPVSIPEWIGNFPPTEKDGFISEIGKPFKVAVHPYPVFQFHRGILPAALAVFLSLV
jgi:hypothetical protein